MLSDNTRKLTYITSGLFFIMGVILFLAHGWAAENFAWTISPFVAMTMGGWYIGVAAMAYEGARVWRWPASHGALIVVWAFSLLQALLLIVHADVLTLGTALGIPYCLMLALAAATAIYAAVDYARARPAVRDESAASAPNPWWSRAMWVAFCAYVTLLVVLLADGIEPDGKIWPGPLSLLTARAFAAFFGSLVLGALPLIFARTLAPIETYIWPGFVMATIIEVAALWFLWLFDFASRPGGLIYHVSYGVAIAGSLIFISYFWMMRRRSAAASPAAGGAS
ncbi:MAG: hypothetical protein DIU80_020690 [Chloroflexota bacterium]|nr:MAG: hypothetical protein DIU80_06945 [Chloroflexota bacterium]